MSNDPGELEQPGPRPDFNLPTVVSVEARRVPHDRPAHRNFESTLPRMEQTVEFLVETDAPIPIRALAPVLYVGMTAVTEVAADDPTHYRFRALTPDALERGAPLSLGWSGQPAGTRVDTEFRFEEPR